MVQKSRGNVKRLVGENRYIDLQGCVIVGIDIAKRHHVARLHIPGRPKELIHSFSNSREGFESFKGWLRGEMDASGYSKAVIGMESTGHYWKALAYELEALSWVTLVQVNPSHVKKVKEVYDGSPLKTDQKDTGVIILLIKMKRIHPLVLPRGSFMDLRVDTRFREQKVVALGVQRNILHSLVDTIFPEYGTLFKRLESKSSLALLGATPTPKEMIQAGLFRISHRLRKASYGRLGKAHAQKILEAAQGTIGIKEGEETYGEAIRRTVEEIRRLLKEIKEVEARLARHLREIPYASDLLKMKGMGVITLSLILGETGDIRHYRKAEEVIKLAGLNLYEVSSGIRRGQRRISKRGRPLLRKVLYFAALRMVKEGGIFREVYLHLTEENRVQRTKAIVALSRKLLRIMVAVVRDKTSYMEGYGKAGSHLAEAA